MFCFFSVLFVKAGALSSFQALKKKLGKEEEENLCNEVTPESRVDFRAGGRTFKMRLGWGVGAFYIWLPGRLKLIAETAETGDRDKCSGKTRFRTR